MPEKTEKPFGAPSYTVTVGDPYGSQFTGVRAFSAEGARVGIVTCRLCGAAILIDPSDEFDACELHVGWHRTMGR